MSEVVGLFGQPVVSTDETNAAAVEEAERLLEMVRSGEIIGFVAVTNYRDGTSGGIQAGLIHYRRIIGTLEVLKYDLIGRDNDG